jgi:PAS domain S-box-containing protein
MSLDLEGRIVNYNEACERASGFADPEAVRNRFFWEVFTDPERQAEVRERFVANASHEPGVYESTFTNARGEQLVIAWSTAPLYDDAGELRNIICGGLDVTERKRRELEIEVERDFANTIAETVPTLLAVVQDDATITEHGVNPAFEQTLGWSRADAPGRNLLQLF